MMSSPSTPSPAAHHLTLSQKEREGRPPRPLLGDAIATTSPPPRHRSTSSQRPQGSASTFCHPSRRVLVLFLSSSSYPPSGGKGRTPSQPGRATPSRSPRRPSPPCRGVPGHMAVKFFLSSENQGHCRAAGALFQAKGKHSNTFSQLIKSLTEKRGRGIKYSKIASKNKNNNYSVRNINFSPNFNREK